MVADECGRRLQGLPDESLRGQVALLKMEGYLSEEIAKRLGCGLRTVARKLEVIRNAWLNRGAPMIIADIPGVGSLPVLLAYRTLAALIKCWRDFDMLPALGTARRRYTLTANAGRGTYRFAGAASSSKGQWDGEPSTRRIRFWTGDVFQVALPDGSFAYGRILLTFVARACRLVRDAVCSRGYVWQCPF